MIKECYFNKLFVVAFPLTDDQPKNIPLTEIDSDTTITTLEGDIPTTTDNTITNEYDTFTQTTTASEDQTLTGNTKTTATMTNSLQDKRKSTLVTKYDFTTHSEMDSSDHTLHTTEFPDISTNTPSDGSNYINTFQSTIVPLNTADIVEDTTLSSTYLSTGDVTKLYSITTESNKHDDTTLNNDEKESSHETAPTTVVNRNVDDKIFTSSAETVPNTTLSPITLRDITNDINDLSETTPFYVEDNSHRGQTTLDTDELIHSSSTIHFESTAKPVTSKITESNDSVSPLNENKNTKTPENRRQLNNFTQVMHSFKTSTNHPDSFKETTTKIPILPMHSIDATDHVDIFTTTEYINFENQRNAQTAATANESDITSKDNDEKLYTRVVNNNYDQLYTSTTPADLTTKLNDDNPESQITPYDDHFATTIIDVESSTLNTDKAHTLFTKESSDGTVRTTSFDASLSSTTTQFDFNDSTAPTDFSKSLFTTTSTSIAEKTISSNTDYSSTTMTYGLEDIHITTSPGVEITKTESTELDQEKSETKTTKIIVNNNSDTLFIQGMTTKEMDIISPTIENIQTSTLGYNYNTDLTTGTSEKVNTLYFDKDYSSTSSYYGPSTETATTKEAIASTNIDTKTDVTLFENTDSKLTTPKSFSLGSKTTYHSSNSEYISENDSTSSSISSTVPYDFTDDGLTSTLKSNPTEDKSPNYNTFLTEQMPTAETGILPSEKGYTETQNDMLAISDKSEDIKDNILTFTSTSNTMTTPQIITNFADITSNVNSMVSTEMTTSEWPNQIIDYSTTEADSLTLIVNDNSKVTEEFTENIFTNFVRVTESIPSTITSDADKATLKSNYDENFSDVTKSTLSTIGIQKSTKNFTPTIQNNASGLETTTYSEFTSPNSAEKKIKPTTDMSEHRYESEKSNDIVTDVFIDYFTTTETSHTNEAIDSFSEKTDPITVKTVINEAQTSSASSYTTENMIESGETIITYEPKNTFTIAVDSDNTEQTPTLNEVTATIDYMTVARTATSQTEYDITLNTTSQVNSIDRSTNLSNTTNKYFTTEPSKETFLSEITTRKMVSENFDTTQTNEVTSIKSNQVDTTTLGYSESNWNMTIASKSPTTEISSSDDSNVTEGTSITYSTDENEVTTESFIVTNTTEVDATTLPRQSNIELDMSQEYYPTETTVMHDTTSNLSKETITHKSTESMDFIGNNFESTVENIVTMSPETTVNEDKLRTQETLPVTDNMAIDPVTKYVSSTYTDLTTFGITTEIGQTKHTTVDQSASTEIWSSEKVSINTDKSLTTPTVEKTTEKSDITGTYVDSTTFVSTTEIEHTKFMTIGQSASTEIEPTEKVSINANETLTTSDTVEKTTEKSITNGTSTYTRSTYVESTAFDITTEIGQTKFITVDQSARTEIVPTQKTSINTNETPTTPITVDKSTEISIKDVTSTNVDSTTYDITTEIGQKKFITFGQSPSIEIVSTEKGSINTNETFTTPLPIDKNTEISIKDVTNAQEGNNSIISVSTSTDNLSSRSKDVDIFAWTESTATTDLTSTELNVNTDLRNKGKCGVNSHCPMDSACINGVCQNPCVPSPCTLNTPCKVVDHAAVCVCDHEAGDFCRRGMHLIKYFAYQK